MFATNTDWLPLDPFNFLEESLIFRTTEEPKIMFKYYLEL